MKHGIHLGIPELDYHSAPEFSQSQAKTLLTCPARYHHELTNRRPEKASFDFGHAAHAKVLGVGLELVAIDAADWRTKKAQEARDAAHAEGKVPLLAKDVAKVDAMAAQIEAHPEARRILASDGRPEVSMWWQDAETGVECRGRVDFLAETSAGLVNVDYKTTTDASPRRFARSAADYRYHLQAAAYEDGLAHLTGDRAPCVLIAQEKDAPYLVGVYRFNDWDVDKGLDLWRNALDLLVKCRTDNQWPGHPDTVTALDLPSWA